MFNDLITNLAVADLLLATIAWHCFITAPGILFGETVTYQFSYDSVFTTTLFNSKKP